MSACEIQRQMRHSRYNTALSIMNRIRDVMGKRDDRYQLTLVHPIVQTTKVTFLVEIRKVILSLSNQEKCKKALLESNLLGIS